MRLESPLCRSVVVVAIAPMSPKQSNLGEQLKSAPTVDWSVGVGSFVVNALIDSFDVFWVVFSSLPLPSSTRLILSHIRLCSSLLSFCFSFALPECKNQS